MLRGYDIDGVITAGIIPKKGSVIITGRSIEESPETYDMLWKKGIFLPVYFNPVLFTKKTLKNSGFWKSVIINLLHITEFYEDDLIQAQVIKANAVKCRLIIVK